MRTLKPYLLSLLGSVAVACGGPLDAPETEPEAAIEASSSALLNSPGSIDTTFGTIGRVRTGFSGHSAIAFSLLEHPAGYLIAAGGSGDAFAVARYRPNGALDTRFPPPPTDGPTIPGSRLLPVPGMVGATAFAQLLLPDGSIVMGGNGCSTSACTNQRLVLTRRDYLFNPISGFGDASGFRQFDLLGFGQKSFTALALQADGRIVTAGWAQGSAGARLVLSRHLSSGVLDTSFGGSGMVVVPVVPGYVNEYGLSIAVQPGGRLVVAGLAVSAGGAQVAVARRFNVSGTLDTTFASGGISTTPSPGYTSVAIQADSRIVLAGSSQGRVMVRRLLTSGAPDTGFGSNGTVLTTLYAATHEVANALRIQQDGRIVIAGAAGSSSSYQFGLARYLANGSLDTSFDVDGRVVTNFSGSVAEWARALVIQADGKLVAAGASDDQFGLARYYGG